MATAATRKPARNTNTAAADTDTAYITAATARRPPYSLSYHRLMRGVALGHVRTEALPGRSVRFREADVARYAAAQL
jgi:hypothetical protein